MTRTKKIRNSFLLVLTALIWGVAFVAQSEGGDAVGTFTFNGTRSVIASLFLLPVILVRDGRKSPEERKRERADGGRRTLLLGGLICGTMLFAGSSLQQLAFAAGASVGKAGFLTALYIMIVPVLGIFLKKRPGLNVWVAVALAVVGFYVMCVGGGFYVEPSDVILLGGAFAFSLHILVIDHFSPRVDGVKLACLQFFTCGLLCLLPMIVWEVGGTRASLEAWMGPLKNMESWIPILYAGLLSNGVGYTLQIIGQNGMDPTVSSLLMSLESVFSVLAGWLLLHQNLSLREGIGCCLIFVGIVLAQLPVRQIRLSLRHTAP